MKYLLLALLLLGCSSSNITVPTQVDQTKFDNTAKNIAKKCTPSVVFIQCSAGWSGTGFEVKVNDKVVIVTAGHVMTTDPTDPTPTFTINSIPVDANKIHLVKGVDIAWIDVQLVPPLEMGKEASIGDDCYAIGDPYNFKNVISVGIVNQYTSDGLLGISSALAPGNSGCPILDNKGKVIGVGVARMNESEHLSFAVPQSQIRLYVR